MKGKMGKCQAGSPTDRGQFCECYSGSSMEDRRETIRGKQRRGCGTSATRHTTPAVGWHLDTGSSSEVQSQCMASIIYS